MKQLFLILIVSMFLSAAEITSFELRTSKTTVMQEELVPLYLTIVTNGNMSIPSLPSIPESSDYAIIGTRQLPPQHRSSLISINGKTTQSISVTYTLEYRIQFRRKGSVTIPSFSLQVGGRSYATAPIVFLVSDASSQPKPMDIQFLGKKSGLYKGERTQMTLKIQHPFSAKVQPTNEGLNDLIQTMLKALDSRVSLTSLNQWQVNQKREVINGMEYAVYEIPFLATMMDTGTISAGPFVFSYNKQEEQGRDFFGQVYYRAAPAQMKTPRLSFSVKSLPKAPTGFTGALNPIKLQSSISATTVPAGESITLSYTISGRMAPNQLGDISLPSLPGVELFTPEKKVSADTTKADLFSKKSYNYILSPTKEGMVTIPAVTLTWFDTKSGSYKTATSTSYTIKVTKGSGLPRVLTRRYLTKNAVTAVAEDIRFIKTSLATNDEDPWAFTRFKFRFLILGPWLVAFVLVVLKLQQKYFPINPVAVRKKRALSTALSVCKALRAGKSKELLTTLLTTYLSDRLTIEAGGLRHHELLAKLPATTTATELINLLEQAELSRYGGGATQEELLSTCETLLKKIDKEILV